MALAFLFVTGTPLVAQSLVSASGPWNVATDPDYLPISGCGEWTLDANKRLPAGRIEVVDIQASANNEFYCDGTKIRGKCLGSYGYNRMLYATATFSIYCANKGVTYGGNISWKQKFSTCDGWLMSNCADNIPRETIDLSAYNPQTGSFTWKGKSLVLPENLIAEYFSKQAFPAVGYSGSSGAPLARPVLFVHGLGQDHTSFGVKSYPGSTTQVESYSPGSAPDVIAHLNRLRVDFDPSRPSEGINANGIYFFNGASADIEEQARILAFRLIDVYQTHYGDQWLTDPEKKLDIVCHSMGCVTLRLLLANYRQAGLSAPQQALLEKALNQLNKVVSINSPHLGSALATDPEYIRSKMPQYSSVADLLEGMNDSAIIAEGSIKLDALQDALVKSTAHGIGATAGTLLGLFTGMDPGITGTAGGFLGTWSVSNAEVNFFMKGPYLGPYQVAVSAGTNIKRIPIHQKVEGPSAMRASIQSMRQHANKLSGQAIETSLGSVGYPKRPDGTPLNMAVLYSKDLRGIQPILLQNLSEQVALACSGQESLTRNQCQKVADLWKAEAMRAQNLAQFLENTSNGLQGMVNEQSLLVKTDFGIDNKLLNLLESLDKQWFAHSDLLVEEESQKFQDLAGRVRPGAESLGNAFEPYREFPLHTLNNPHYPYRMIPHGPLPISAFGDAGRKLDGATRAGLDIACALSPLCGAERLTDGSARQPIRLSESLTKVKVPVQTIPDHFQLFSLSARTVELSGDFAVTPLLGGNHFHGLAVVDATGNSQLTLVFQPGYGVFAKMTGHSAQWLANTDHAVQLTVMRRGNTLVAKATDWENHSHEAEFPLPSPTTSTTLAVFGGEAAPDNIALTGQGEPTAAASQLPPAGPGSLAAVLHRETAQSSDPFSRPLVLFYNGTEQPIANPMIRYWFTVPAADVPQFELLQGQVDRYSLNDLGEGRFELVLELTGSAAPKSLFPKPGGLVFQLSLASGASWIHDDDWSHDHNPGILLTNRHIVAQTQLGQLLWGIEPDAQELAIQQEQYQPSAQVFTRHEALYEQNILKPKLRIVNNSNAPIQEPSLLYFVQIPVGREPMEPHVWWSNGETVTMSQVEPHLYVLNYTFTNRTLMPGDTLETGSSGFSLADWAAWPHEANPSFVASNDYVLNEHVVAFDGQGHWLWGSEPKASQWPEPPPPSNPDLGLDIWNEAPWQGVYPKIRIKVHNQGQGLVKAFTLRFPISSSQNRVPQLDAKWHAPGCEAQIPYQPQQGAYALELHCQNLMLRPGETWPDNAGGVIGMHYLDWSSFPFEWENAANVQVEVQQ